MRSLLCAILSLCEFAAPARADFEWRKAKPEEQGLSAEKLEALRATLAEHNTKALLIILNDHIVLEWYAPGHSATARHYTASMAKALVAGLAVALALSDGRLKLDDLAVKYIPQWKDDPRKAKITLRQLGSHTSGLDDSRPNEAARWKDDFWKRLPPPNDPFTISRDKTPLVAEPGKKFQYSNPGIGLLTFATTAALKKDVRSLLRDRVMRPIGVADRDWSIGYGQTVQVDGLPLVPSWGGGNYTARATARVARLMLREGDWDGKRLLSRDAVRLTTGDAGTPGICGIGWWSNNDGTSARLPRDAYWASGAGHQIALVVPSRKLIVVRNGGALTPATSHEPVRRLLFEPLMDVIDNVPYPRSKVITDLQWAPKADIVRRAKGSDNWPLTWADDDHLYGAYGDGNGFVPFTPIKLSLGLARIEGGPTDFKGVNIRAATLEQKGEGKDGKKASGLLMIDGVLYLWARNAGNAQLAWSADRGKTWTWADWKLTTSFGCPTFLQFGRNYAGARDEYVYVSSHDADSAYEAADRMVMARVKKDSIRRRDAYEFFVKLGEKGEPVWTRDVARRGAVFTSKGNCYRSGVSYNAALRRYLWCQVLPQSKDKRGTRFQGGFGVYDAPQPWGPWTTVYHRRDWDVGPGETSSFPPKWMSQDGRTLHLVFSGDDCFSVRRATLRLR